MSAALRVFVVLPDGSPAAAHRATVEILSHLPRHDVEPIVCFLGEGPLCGFCRDDLGVETVLVPVKGRRGALQAVEPVLRGARAGLVHSISARVHLLAGKAARRVGLRAVWSQFETPDFGTIRALRAALRPARAVLAASGAIERRQHRFNPRRVPVEKVAPGVTLYAEPGGGRREFARASLGVVPGEVAVGWMAGRAPAAERDLALHAVATLCHARPAARLIVIPCPAAPANKGLKDSLRPLATSLGIAHRISVSPPHEMHGASPVLAALDIALDVRADGDPVALAPIEALAAGVPVVATDREPVREVVAHGRAGLLVPPGDAEAAAAALLTLADDPDLRARYAAQAWESALRDHDAAAVAARVAAIYRRAVQA